MAENTQQSKVADGGLWLFGYGSLIWKPPPSFDERVPGYIENYVRRFWQASEDHRGTPSAPGRVVTLIEQSNYESLVEKALDSPLRVWGAAYHIPPPHVAEVQAYLDIREVNGYSIQHTTFHQSPSTVTEGGVSSISNVLVYIGLPSNPQFTGPESVASVAEVIRCSKGPSGDNPTYLFMLEEALENLSAESTDEHVTEVAAAVRHLIEKGSGEPIGVTSDSTGVT